MVEDKRLQMQPLGESEVFLDFQEKLSKVAPIERSVLIIGERGTGKEIAANRLHYLSGRWEGPLVAVNCAALPSSLLETELFGHEAGAFTGATKARKGRFEEAEGGTLFLDEIGLIPLEVQEKILRVVEYGTFERVGSSTSHQVNVRIVGATNADLKQLCKEGKFKEDLLDRLSFEVLFLPPLRERGDDILLLAHHFASRMSFECGFPDIPVFSDEVEQQLLAYSWPGNVRELKNVVERAVYKSDGKGINEVDFDPFRNPFPLSEEEKPASLGLQEEEIKEIPVSGSFPCAGKIDLALYQQKRQEFDVTYLRQALGEANGNQREAARLMNLTYDQLRGMYRKFKDNL
ncbi:MAG: phage shock protein operon transcriptional activator [Spirochaetia bacterium]|jgi:psp operon transcriptional activator|nr:phage shock protein operon transcriptional activator [Spirochaetia bacterium]